MTIPIIPGPWSALGQGLEGGLNAYNQEQDQQYARARASAGLIMGMIQSGRLDPKTFADPAMLATFQKAQIPVPSPENIVPSVPAMAARETQKVVEGAPPGAEGRAQRMITLGVPGLPSQVSEEELKGFLTKLVGESTSDPAFARRLAGILPPGVAQQMELGQQANPTPTESSAVARRFVANAWMNSGGQPGDPFDVQAIAQRARDAAAADPQLGKMVASGQLDIGYFANAAQELAQQGEENRIKWAAAFAAQARAQNSQKDFYFNQIKSYDEQIRQKQNDLKMNVLDPMTQGMLQTAQTKESKGVALNKFEKVARAKEAAQAAAQAEIDRLTKERQDLLDQYIGARNPINPAKTVVPPQGGAPGARRSQTYPPPTPYRGHAAPAEPVGSSSVSSSVRGKTRADTKQAPPQRAAGMSDADYWQQLFNMGFNEQEATGIVERSKKR